MGGGQGKDLGASSEISHRRTEAEGRSVECREPQDTVDNVEPRDLELQRGKIGQGLALRR